MTRVGQLLGRLPGIPSYESRGRKRLRKALGEYEERYDPDMVALVRSDIGWDFVPVARHEVGGQMWAEPLDSGAPWYPADGVPEDPPELWGVPVAVGYRDFGALPEVPNAQFVDGSVQAGQRTVAPPAASAAASDRPSTESVISEAMTAIRDPSAVANVGRDEDTEDDADESDSGDWLDDLRARWQRWRDERRIRKRRKRARKGLQMLQADSGALLIKQDGDSVLTAKGMSYDTESDGPQWYVSDDDKDQRYDARGAGAGPISLDEADIGVAYGPIPKLVAPVLPRVARNLHSLRVVDAARPPEVDDDDADEVTAPTPANGTDADATGDAAADGGWMRHNDIIVEERALVDLSDTTLLGGEHETQDHLDSLEEQVKALANPPGGQWLETASRLGGIILAFIIGVTLGDPSGIIELIGGAI